jgi:hypothetical protein
VLLGVVLAGHYFADLSMLDLILLAAAPLGAWVGEIPVFKSKRPRFAARIVAVLIILASPLVPALKGLRETMQELTNFGDGGRQPGQFYGVHSVATDSKGNLYTTETYEGKRLQKFVFKGVGTVKAGEQGVLWPRR